MFPVVPTRGNLSPMRSVAPRVVAAGPSTTPSRSTGPRVAPVGSPVHRGVLGNDGMMGTRVQGNALGESTTRPSLRPKEVKLDKPLTFSGKRKDLANFLFVMRQYIDSVGLGNGSEACRFLVSYLRDDALTWWRSYNGDSLSIFDTLDLETLMDDMEDHFSDIDKDMKLRDKLFSLRQTGSVQDYVTRFKQI